MTKDKEDKKKKKITKHMELMKKHLRDGKLGGIFLGEGKKEKKDGY